MKYIYISIITIVITCFLTLIRGFVQIGFIDAPLTRISAHLTSRMLPHEDSNITRTIAERKDAAIPVFVPVVPLVASYSETNRAWTFSAKVVQLRDVSIYGRPGAIAKVEYIREGASQYVWAVIKIDDYYFTDHNAEIAEGQEIRLEVSGEHVSSKGVHWDACAHNDKYCEYASFIEGGFPVSEDYNGLTICPSNALIYSGYSSDDWINGMLAWKIKIES